MLRAILRAVPRTETLCLGVTRLRSKPTGARQRGEPQRIEGDFF